MSTSQRVLRRAERNARREHLERATPRRQPAQVRSAGEREAVDAQSAAHLTEPLGGEGRAAASPAWIGRSRRPRCRWRTRPGRDRSAPSARWRRSARRRLDARGGRARQFGARGVAASRARGPVGRVGDRRAACRRALVRAISSAASAPAAGAGHPQVGDRLRLGGPPGRRARSPSVARAASKAVGAARGDLGRLARALRARPRTAPAVVGGVRCRPRAEGFGRAARSSRPAPGPLVGGQVGGQQVAVPGQASSRASAAASASRLSSGAPPAPQASSARRRTPRLLERVSARRASRRPAPGPVGRGGPSAASRWAPRPRPPAVHLVVVHEVDRTRAGIATCWPARIARRGRRPRASRAARRDERARSAGPFGLGRGGARASSARCRRHAAGCAPHRVHRARGARASSDRAVSSASALAMRPRASRWLPARGLPRASDASRSAPRPARPAAPRRRRRARGPRPVDPRRLGVAAPPRCSSVAPGPRSTWRRAASAERVPASGSRTAAPVSRSTRPSAARPRHGPPDRHRQRGERRCGRGGARPPGRPPPASLRGRIVGGWACSP